MYYANMFVVARHEIRPAILCGPGGQVPIALLYYSANVIVVLCTGQLIIRMQASVSYGFTNPFAFDELSG